MKEELLVKYFGAYLRFFHHQRFIWQAVHGIPDRTLTDVELRACIDDVCEYARQRLTINGVPLAVDMDAHVWLKTQLERKLMGRTKDAWVKPR